MNRALNIPGQCAEAFLRTGPPPPGGEPPQKGQAFKPVKELLPQKVIYFSVIRQRSLALEAFAVLGQVVGPEDAGVPDWSQRVWLRGSHILRFEAQREVVDVLLQY